MALRLVEQLVDAGLITEAQARASDSGDPSVPSVRIVQSLVASGLSERVLAGFFVSLGFGPILQARELARADEMLVRRLPGTDAHELGAIPLRQSHAGAIIAMADPSDERAVAKLGEALGGRVLPTVATLSDLLVSIERAYPPDRPTLVTDPMGLARRRTPSGVVSLARDETAIGADPPAAPFDPSFAELASTASPVWDRAWSRSTTERQVSLPSTAGQIPLPTVSRSPRPSVAPATLRPGTMSDPDLDARLIELEQVTSRDEVVRVACQACLATARGAAFLALRKGVFRGWDGAGDDVTSAGIRSLWVPASNPSILNEVLHTGRAFRGAYGQTAADHLVRTALGRQSHEVLIVPVMVGSRLIGVLCAKDPDTDSSAVERVADAMGLAFERLIVSRKSDS
jgi:hypothetical protein